MFERTNPKVSLVIPCWFTLGMDGSFGLNETYTIASQCLKRIIEVTPKELFELILVDNGSTLTTNDIDFIEAGVPTLEWFWGQADVVIRNKENLGFAPAVNQGINLSRGKFVIVMNDDILVWEGWIETMIKDFEENENKLGEPIGLLMPAITKEKIRFWDAIKLKKEEVDMKTNAGKFGEKAEFGSMYLGRKELFMEVAKRRGGYQVLDENFKCGMGEDRWLYREIRMLGKNTFRTHNLRVLHVGNLTIGKIKDRKDYTFENRKYLEKLKRKHNVD